MAFWAVNDPAILAYFDPTLGSFIIQFFVAGMLGAGIFLRRQLLGAVTWFRSRRRA